MQDVQDAGALIGAQCPRGLGPNRWDRCQPGRLDERTKRGALTIETIFAFPGMGKLMFDAIMGNDYNLALTGFLILTSFVLLANFAADLLYAALDPRVKTGAA